MESVGATRTVAVSEGTPGRAGTATPHHGPNGAKVRSGGTDGSRSVVVGVLDSGIDAGRPDTSPTSWLPTTSDHGTHVAGTIAAARNGVGIVGVAPNVRVASVKVVNDDGFIYPEYAVCGFVWAATHHMDVTNNSYYVDPYEFWCDDQPDQAAAMEAVRRAVQLVGEAGRRQRRRGRQQRLRPGAQDHRRRQPGRRDHAGPAHDQQRLQGHPHRAARRGDRVLDRRSERAVVVDPLGPLTRLTHSTRSPLRG